MSNQPPILSYGKTHVVSMHLSEDRSTLDVEIHPKLTQEKTSVIVGAICGLLPFIGLFYFTRNNPNAWLLMAVALILLPVIAGILYWASVSSKETIRIHVDRLHISVDRRSALSTLSRRWEREEIRDIRVERRAWTEGRKWSIFVQLPVTDSMLAGGLEESEARAIAEGLHAVLKLPNDTAVIAPALATPSSSALTLDYASVPSRYGVIINRSPQRLTIIVPVQDKMPFFKSIQRTEAIIELDRHMLSVDCIDRSENGSNERLNQSWPRDQVASIKGDLYGMGLTIRISGKEIFEMLHRYPQELRVWIAQALSDELRQECETVPQQVQRDQ